MVERSLSMREVPGSMPGFSIFFFASILYTFGIKARSVNALDQDVYVLQLINYGLLG